MLRQIIPQIPMLSILHEDVAELRCTRSPTNSRSVRFQDMCARYIGELLMRIVVFAVETFLYLAGCEGADYFDHHSLLFVVSPCFLLLLLSFTYSMCVSYLPLR